MMRTAIIDCGTNTFNLLIADNNVTGYKHIFKTKRVVKLGATGIMQGIIGPGPKEKAIKALSAYKGLISKYKAEKIIVIGTSALREASNGAALLNEIYEKTGFKIQLIDGDEEARLIYQGVSKAMNLGDETSLIMDIGGGSVEFILCNERKIYWKKSFRIGVARLTAFLSPGDPIKNPEILKLNKYLAEILDDLFLALKMHPATQIIGSSGTFDTLAAILLNKQGKPNFLRNKTHYQFLMADYTALHKELIHSTYKERLRIPGMLRMRADMIVLASLLLTFVIRNSGIEKLHLSTYSLKEGLLT